MSKGIEIQGEIGARTLSFNGVVVAYGGSGSEGLHADGNNLILDGAVIATSTEDPNLGLYVKDGALMFGDAVVGNEEQEEQTYPQGLTNIGYRVPYVNGNAKQGAAIYKDKLYQFYHGGHVEVVDLLTLGKTTFEIPDIWPTKNGIPNSQHCSCAAFSNQFAEAGDELPLVYISAVGYTCVINLNVVNVVNGVTTRGSLVRWWYIDHNIDGVTYRPAVASIGAWDFANHIGYSIGYPQGIPDDSANHKSGGMFEVLRYTFPTSGTGEVSVVAESTKVILHKPLDNNETAEDGVIYVSYVNNVADGNSDSDWSNLQDADFKNGHIFILYGGSNGGADHPKIIDYIPAQASAIAMYTNICKDGGTGAEGEGMAKYKNGWVVTNLYANDYIFVL